MFPYKRLLVGLTLDKRDHALLTYAAEFARHAGVEEIHFIHVSEMGSLPKTWHKTCAHALAPHDTCLPDRIREKIQTAFPPRLKIKIRLEMLEGSPLLELLRLARKKNVDAVVVGQRRGRDTSPLAEKLARKAPCSVLVVPSGSSPRFQRLLVPTDFSGPSAEAVKTSLDLAKALKLDHVTLVHAFSIPAAYAQARLDTAEWHAALLQQARRDYSDFVKHHQLPAARLKVAFKVSNRPVVAIRKLAKIRRTDLLVVSARGRSDLADFLLGSLVEVLLRHADQPLLTVRHKGANRSILDALLARE